MTVVRDETDGDGRKRSQDKGAVVRLSINLSTETADEFKTLLDRQGLTITEGIRRAIRAWQFLEDERSKGNEIAVIEQNDIRRVILL
jgi:hypothetical protein